MRRLLGGVALVLGAALLVSAVGIGRDDAPAPSATASPGTEVPPGDAADAAVRTRAAVLRALRDAGFEPRDAEIPFRPAEAAELSAAPRRVLHVPLPDDPEGAFVTIYGFRSVDAAAEAGHRQAAHLASGPVRIRYPRDARFVLRQVGATLVLHVWAPSVAPPGAEGIESALERVGRQVPVAA